MAKLRALENPDETQCRQEQNRAHMTMKRGTTVSVDNAISTFLLKAKMGPDYVCTCCHRMMYKQNVVSCSKSKYVAKASNELLEQVFSAELSYLSNDGNLWLCRTCDSTLSRGNLLTWAG